MWNVKNVQDNWHWKESLEFWSLEYLWSVYLTPTSETKQFLNTTSVCMITMQLYFIAALVSDVDLEFCWWRAVC